MSQSGSRRLGASDQPTIDAPLISAPTYAKLCLKKAERQSIALDRATSRSLSRCVISRECELHSTHYGGRWNSIKEDKRPLCDDGSDRRCLEVRAFLTDVEGTTRSSTMVTKSYHLPLMLRRSNEPHARVSDDVPNTSSAARMKERQFNHTDA